MAQMLLVDMRSVCMYRQAVKEIDHVLLCYIAMKTGQAQVQ